MYTTPILIAVSLVIAFGIAVKVINYMNSIDKQWEEDAAGMKAVVYGKKGTVKRDYKRDNKKGLISFSVAPYIIDKYRAKPLYF